MTTREQIVNTIKKNFKDVEKVDGIIEHLYKAQTAYDALKSDATEWDGMEVFNGYHTTVSDSIETLQDDIEETLKETEQLIDSLIECDGYDVENALETYWIGWKDSYIECQFNMYAIEGIDDLPHKYIDN